MKSFNSVAALTAGQLDRLSDRQTDRRTS